MIAPESTFLAGGTHLGNELPCTIRRGHETFAGKALLESSEILFRGDVGLKIAFAAITAIDAVDGRLHVRTKEGLTLFELGPHAERWRDKIANPKPVLAKLGVKPGASVALLGDLPLNFAASLRKWGATIGPAKNFTTSHVFLAVDRASDLRQLRPARKTVHGTTALWIVFPKGQQSITAEQVRSAGLAAGLVDIKVVSFSPTHTALKFVLPKSKR